MQCVLYTAYCILYTVALINGLYQSGLIVTQLYFSWKPILEHIDNKYEEYLNAEGHVNRSDIVDNRVHCCLYFISPGHGYVF